MDAKFILPLVLAGLVCAGASARASGPGSQCEASLKAGAFQTALEQCEAELSAYQTDINHPAVLDIYLQLAAVYHQLGKRDIEHQYLGQIRQHPAFADTTHIRQEWNRRMGQWHYFKAEYSLSAEYLRRALDIAQVENNSVWLSKSHNDVGLVESKLENYKQALFHYQQSLDLKLQIGDDYQIGNTLNNLGLIHLQLEQAAQAVDYYERALQRYLRYTNGKDFDRRVYYQIAHIYEDLTKAHQANNSATDANYYADAVFHSLDLKVSKHEQVRALINLARWHIEKGELVVADTFLASAERKLQDQDNPEYRLQLHTLKGRLFQAMKQPDSAIQETLTALQHAQHLGNQQSLAELYLALSSMYEPLDVSQALATLKQYQLHRESFLKKKYDSEIQTIQHRIEKQQVEQDLLVKELENAAQRGQIQKLTNTALAFSSLLIITLTAGLFYHQKRVREKQDLLKAIQYHQQQLLVLESERAEKEGLAEGQNNVSELKTRLKHQLVKTMLDAVSVWERHTLDSRIELAEQSKIWTVSIDNGTLRTRSLDNYLSIDKIPQNPRWRNVVKTCHYILTIQDLPADDRQQLNQHIDSVMRLIRELSLTNRTA